MVAIIRSISAQTGLAVELSPWFVASSAVVVLKNIGLCICWNVHYYTHLSDNCGEVKDIYGYENMSECVVIAESIHTGWDSR